MIGNSDFTYFRVLSLFVNWAGDTSGYYTKPQKTRQSPDRLYKASTDYTEPQIDHTKNHKDDTKLHKGYTKPQNVRTKPTQNRQNPDKLRQNSNICNKSSNEYELDM